MARRPLVLAAVAVSLVPAGLGARMLPGEWGNVGGGLLYAGLLYVLCGLVAPRARPVVLGGAAAVIGVGVEVLQLTPLPGALQELIPVARYVLGSTFAVGDLAIALVGAGLTCAVDSVLRRDRGGAGQSDAPDRGRDDVEGCKVPGRCATCSCSCRDSLPGEAGRGAEPLHLREL